MVIKIDPKYYILVFDWLQLHYTQIRPILFYGSKSSSINVTGKTYQSIHCIFVSCYWILRQNQSISIAVLIFSSKLWDSQAVFFLNKQTSCCLVNFTFSFFLCLNVITVPWRNWGNKTTMTRRTFSKKKKKRMTSSTSVQQMTFCFFLIVICVKLVQRKCIFWIFGTI